MELAPGPLAISSRLLSPGSPPAARIGVVSGQHLLEKLGVQGQGKLGTPVHVVLGWEAGGRWKHPEKAQQPPQQDTLAAGQEPSGDLLQGPGD